MSIQDDCPLTSARRLATWTAGLRWKDVPDDQRPLVGLRVLDTVGLILAGLDTPAAAPVMAVAGSLGRTPECRIAGSGLLSSPANAALAHGTLAHCRDFDDTFTDSVVHPGSTIVSSALAIGATAHAADEEIGTAILAGYEAVARIGAAAGRQFHARGFHPTGILGTLGAAVSTSRIYQLGPDGITDALGLAASMSSGLMAFVDDGTWSKWLHAGWAAHGGIIAAQHARSGFRGPAGVLDGRHNLYSAFLGRQAPTGEELWGDLGSRWAGGNAHFKYYPCAHVIQPYIDAAIRLRLQHHLDPGAVNRVVCTIAPWAVPIVCEPRQPKLKPQSDMDAIASLPYQVAAALVDGRVDLTVLESPCRTRAEILALAQRIVHAEDPALGREFDGSITIELDDGRKASGLAHSSPPDRDKLVAKFRSNAARTITPDLSDRIEQAILSAPLPDFSGLNSLLNQIQERSR